jgi:hypothetical protein
VIDRIALERSIDPIGGWLEIKEACALALLAEGQVVLEVGSYEGRSTVAMAPYAQKIICIDHFHSAVDGQGRDDAKPGTRQKFNENTAPWKDKIEVHEMDSKDAVKDAWPEIGLLFIDGGHDYDTVKSDLGFMRFVKIGGYAAFHDMMWLDVERVLREEVEPSPNWKCIQRVGAVCVFQRVAGKDPPDGFGRIVLAIPYERFVYGEFMDDIMALQAEGLRKDDLGIRIRGLPTHRARNHLIRMFLKLRETESLRGRRPPDTLCFIDSDQRFQPDTLERLRTMPMASEYDVLQAWYCVKFWPYQPIIMRHTEEGNPYGCEGWWHEFVHLHKDWEWGDLVNCDGLGGGFTLIRARVLESLISPMGIERTQWFQYVNDCSEDLFFCKHAAELGFKIGVDTAVQIGHIKHHNVGPHEYEMFVAEWEAGKCDKDGKKIKT